MQFLAGRDRFSRRIDLKNPAKSAEENKFRTENLNRLRNLSRETGEENQNQRGDRCAGARRELRIFKNSSDVHGDRDNDEAGERGGCTGGNEKEVSPHFAFLDL